MNPEMIQTWREELREATPRQVIRWAYQQFGKRLVQATGLGAEDQIVTHLLAVNAPDIGAVFVDTGRHFQETHELLALTAESYGMDIRLHLPNGGALEEMVAEHGANLFHQSVALRRRCCAVRKHQPLARALAPYDAWLSGRRSEQGRDALEVVSWDEANQMVRIDPLWNWTEKKVWDYVRLQQIPYNELHNQGYAYPGCASCTRAIKPGESFCNGRWWWETEQANETVALRV